MVKLINKKNTKIKKIRAVKHKSSVPTFAHEIKVSAENSTASKDSRLLFTINKVSKKYVHAFSLSYVVITLVITVIGLAGQSKLQGAISLFLEQERFGMATSSVAKPLGLYGKSATISLQPATSRFVVINERFSADVFISSPAPVKSIEAIISFDKDKLELIGILKDSSIIDEWTLEPSFSDDSGLLSFGGMIYSDEYSGSGKILTVVFKPKKTGRALIEFANTLVLAHNNIPFLVSKESATYVVREVSLFRTSSGLNINDLIHLNNIPSPPLP